MPTKTKKKSEPFSDTILKVHKRFVDAYEFLKRPNPFFQLELEGDVTEVSPVDYWNNGRRIFNALVAQTERKASEKWKSTYSTGLARNKILGIVAHVVSQYMSPTIMAQNKQQAIDKAVSLFLKDILEHSLDKEKFYVTQFFATITSMAEGTCFLEENYYDLKETRKDITSQDDETGDVKWTEKEVQVWKGPKYSIIPNDHVLVSDPYQRDLNKNDYVIVYYRGTKDSLGRYFGKYAKWDEVEAGRFGDWADESDDNYKRFREQIELVENECVVIKHYDLINDTLDIIANGVQLTKEGNPIPRPVEKKRLPIVKLIAEPIDNDFYLGKSISDRLGKEENALNLLYRMFYDREFLNTFPPLETDNENLLTEDLLSPKVVMSRKPGGQGTTPVLQGQASTGIQNLIAKLESNADQNSVGNMMLGQTPTGGTPTATQTLQMVKQAQTILNLFNEMQRMFMADLGELRIETLLWRLDKDDLKYITVHDKVLTGGGRGSRSYFLEQGIRDMTEESKMGVSVQLMKAEREAKGELEAVVIDKDELLENMDYYVRFDAEPTPRRNSDLDKLMAERKLDKYAAMPQIFNIKEAAKGYAEAMGDDPNDVVLDEAQMPQPGAQMSQPKPTSPQPITQAMGLPQ